MKNQPSPLQGIRDLCRELDARVERHPDYADYRNMRGLARAHAGDLDGALVDLQESLRRNPRYADALMNLAWLYVERREVGRLRELLDGRGGRGLSSSRRGHVKMLEAYGRWGPHAALEIVESYAPRESPPTDPWLELDRLWLLWQDKRSTDADAQLRRLVSWVPEAESHLRAVGVFEDHGIDPHTAQVWAEAYRGNPNVAGILRECARICACGGPDLRGDDLLHWSVALSLDLCGFWLAVGAHHDMGRRAVEAESAFRQAVAADPKHAQPHIQLGLLFAALGKPRKSVYELERALDLQPRFADVRYLLGLLHEDLGRVDDAEAEYRNALAINPGFVMARLALGSLLEASGILEEALKMLELVRTSGLSSVDLEERLARIYDSLGRREAADEARQRALDLADDGNTA